MTGGAYAQDEEEPAVASTPQDEDTTDETSSDDRIVVTGSRVRRDEFTSTSPLQIVDSETIAESGVVDVGDILRNTTVVQGVQLDQQFNSNFVSDAGPGGQAVALRGLEPDRTLLLVNGRRYAPAGVEGAPAFPDISLLPSSMIERIDILLDGASSVYGSDAVAGVVNVILRDEFEGFEVGAFKEFPESSGGQETRFNFIMGDHSDKASFLLAGEYRRTEELRGNDRDWMYNGLRYGPTDIVQLSDDDEGPADGLVAGTSNAWQSFVAVPLGAAVGEENTLGFRFLTGRPGAGDYNDNFSFWGGDGDELYAANVDLNQDEWLTPEFESTSLYAKGTYDLSDTLPGTQAFVEMGFSNRQTYLLNPWQSFDLSIAQDSPFNIFNAAEAGYTGLITTSDITLRPTQPWQDELQVELDQWRIFSGLQGDLGFAGLSSWDYEVFAGYTRSQGFSRRTGVHEDHLYLSLAAEYNMDSGLIECPERPDLAGGYSSSPTYEACQVFDPTYPGLWQLGVPPTLDNPDAVAWLRGERIYDTFVDERIAGGFATGPIMQLPAGDLQGVLGFEWREDAIETHADDNAARGGIRGFFSDRPSNGSVELWEAFGELVIPIVSGQPGIEHLDLELAGRFVNHEFYGENSVYSVRSSYRPVDWITLRGTYGTSFRAPNLRELFLEGQSSFSADPDPCRIPGIAQVDSDNDGIIDFIDPDLDTRTPQAKANCLSEGIDPDTFGYQVFGGSVEVFSAGNTGLDPETSTAWSAGVVVEQPFTDAFDLRLGVNAWEIEVEDSVYEPTALFLVTQCYNSTNFPDDPFCTRRKRDPNTQYLLEIDATPFNVASELAKGVDLNLSFAKDFTAAGRDFTATLDMVSTYTEENSQTIILEGSTDYDDNAGDIGTPEWRATANARLMFDDFTLFWQTRYIGEQSDTDLTLRPSNCYDSINDIVLSERCYTLPEYYVHDASISWQPDTWTFRVGVLNVFNEDPPIIDEDVNAAIDARSVPIGIGYDRVGRSVFVNVSKAF